MAAKIIVFCNKKGGPGKTTLAVKKSLEADYPPPKGVAFRPLHGFATAISKTTTRA